MPNYYKCANRSGHIQIAIRDNVYRFDNIGNIVDKRKMYGN